MSKTHHDLADFLHAARTVAPPAAAPTIPPYDKREDIYNRPVEIVAVK